MVYSSEKRGRGFTKRLGAFAAGILAFAPIEDSHAETTVPEGVEAVSAIFSTENPHQPVEAMTWKEKLKYLSQVEFSIPYVVMNFVDPDTGKIRVNWKALLEPITLKFGYETGMKMLDIDIRYEYAPDFVRTNPQSEEAYEYYGKQIRKSFQEALVSEITGLSFFKDEIRRYPLRDQYLDTHNNPGIKTITVIGEASSEGDAPESVLRPETSADNMALAWARAEHAKISLLEALPWSAFDDFDPKNILVDAKVYALTPEEINEFYAIAFQYGFRARNADSIFRLYALYNDGKIKNPEHVKVFERVIDAHRGSKIHTEFQKGQHGAVILGMPLWLVLLWVAQGAYRHFRPTPVQQEEQRRRAQEEVNSPRSRSPELRLLVDNTRTDVERSRKK